MQQLNFGMLVRIVRRFWVWAIVCAIAGACIMGAVTHFFIPNQYISRAKLYIQNGNLVEDHVSTGDLAAAQALVNRTCEIFNTNFTLERAAQLLNDGTTSSELAAALSFGSTANNEAVIIRATAEDPATAYLYCSAIVSVAPEVLSELYETAKVKVLDEASLPVVPSAPNMVQNCMAGAILGVLLLIIIVVVREMTDMRIGNGLEFKQRMGDLTILGEIPSFKTMSKGDDKRAQ